MAAFQRLLIAAILAIATGSALAGFAEAIPPSGWSAGTGAGNTFQFGSASNAAVYSSNGVNTVRTTAALNVAGRQVAVPAAMRFAANAPVFAARSLFLNPYLAAASLGLVGIQWWLSQSSVRWDESQQKWLQTQSFGWPIGTGLEYKTAYTRGTDVYKPTKEAACQQMAVTANALVQGGGYAYQAVSGSTCILSRNGTQNSFTSNITQRTGGCPVGTYVSPQGQCMVSGTQDVPLTPEQFETIIPGIPMPARVPTEMPIPLPVEQPVINPDPYPAGNPSPLFVPTGNPIWDPASQSWKQPGVRVVPSPNPASPWRVDYQPVEVPRPDATPLPDPVPDPFKPNAPSGSPLETPTPSQTQTGVQSPNANPGTATSVVSPAQQPLLCDVFPNIVACQKLGTGTASAVPNQNKPLAFTKQDGFGPSNGSCPPARSLVLMGKTMSFSWQPMCDFATGLRPIILALAYLSAALTFMGLSRKE